MIFDIYILYLNMYQHVQLPNSMTESENITAKDLVIYLTLKRHNGEKGCFPSLETISKESGAAINTVRKCIDNLIKDGYITKERVGKYCFYKFSPYKNFEPFSYEFLDKEDLTFIQKSYLAASQQYMYIDGENSGKISMSNRELAGKIKLSESTVSKCNKALEEKNYLTIIDTKAKDVVTGCNKKEKIFALQQFGQAVAYALKNHEDRITENTEEIKSLKKDNELLMREIQSLKEQLTSHEKIIL